MRPTPPRPLSARGCPRAQAPLRGLCVPAQAGNRRGFALLISIVLMAFIITLLISLAAFTQVEIKTAADSGYAVQARQNALYALQSAIAQLQTYAGPDQRTTARADIDADLVATTSANGNWIGVYGNSVAPAYADRPAQIADKLTAYYDANSDSPLARKGSQAILLNWLVSGNEGTEFDPFADVAADGHISRSAPPSIRYAPDDTINLQTVKSSPTADETSVLLVGAGSADAAHDYVSAPLVPIGDEQNSPTGRYGWWVGDENIKARVNIAPATGATATIDPNFAFVVAQRAAIELVDGTNASHASAPFELTDLIGDSYNPANPLLSQLVAIEQLPMLEPQQAQRLNTARKKRFHDLTSHSFSVLSDTYAGGLRQDLSARLAAGATSPADTDFIFPPDSNDSKDSFGFPTWGKLRSFARQTTNGTTALPPRLPTDTDAGFAPILTFAEVGLEYFDSVGSARLAVFPRAVLWNPYSTPIAPARYEFGISIAKTAGLFQLQSRRVTDAGFIGREETRYLGRAAKPAPSSGSDPNAFLRFVIDVTEEIPPGESHIFVLSSNGNYNTTDTSQPNNIMTRGVLGSYAVLPDTGLTVEPGELFRVAGNGSNHLQPDSPNVNASLNGRSFHNNASAYLGEVSNTGPDGAEWPAANKPWYQVMGRASEGGAPAYHWLQGGDGGYALSNSPGTNLWGIQIRHVMANRIRHIANTNPRAPFRARLPLQGSRILDSNQGTGIMSNDFDPSPDARASAAMNLNVIEDTPSDSILFEFRPDDRPLLSLGQLQHANLSFIADLPAYPLGNSLAPYMRLDTSGGAITRNRLQRTDGSSTIAPSNLLSGHYDISYLLNRALWDRYFVSTVPHAGTGATGDTNETPIPTPLPNARLVRHSTSNEADLRDAQKAAANLLISGGFNINSTSEQAWRAVLGGLNQLAHEADGTPDAALAAAFPRFARPPAAIAVTTDSSDWAFSGYRRLSEEQIAALAANIVTEIRNRGPFISLGDFINRRLKDNPDTTPPATGTLFNADETLKGVLQSAIDNTPVSGTASINNARDQVPFTGSGPRNIDANEGGTELDGAAMRGGPASSGNIIQHPYGSLSAFAPQSVTQADILSVIGPSLSARSDTFTIRAYGDSVNQQTGEVIARAWCEAVVQRTVEPVRRSSNSPSSPNYNEPAAATANNPDFGRRFSIISFRWLTPDDI